MAIEFNPIVWRDGEAPDISADNLNRYETVIPQLVEKVNSLTTLSDMKELWTGMFHMTADQTAPLSEKISEQKKWHYHRV